MDRSDTFVRNIRLERNGRPTFRRLALVGASLLIFTVMWRIVPADALFWLMLPVLTVLIWVASHGWRFVLVAADKAIHFLMDISNGGFR